MIYRFTWLNKRLVLISWSRTPDTIEAAQYIRDLKQLLDTAEEALYFITDLRRGRIIDLNVIRHLVDLSHHANWAGSTAFTENPISQIFGTTYQRLMGHKAEKNQVFNQPADAIAFLEALCPRITEGINWTDQLALTDPG